MKVAKSRVQVSGQNRVSPSLLEIKRTQIRANKSGTRVRHMNLCRLWAVAILLACGAALADETYKLDIPEQPLSKALQSFAEQSGIQIVYYVQLAEGRTASRVLGTMSANEAL